MYDTTTRHPDFEGLYLVASGQMGHFTSAQAREFGISRMLLHHHARTGWLIRVYRGVYRFRDYPSEPREHVAAAWLAVGKDIAVVSHETALDILELSDVIPNAIELTIPRSSRYRTHPAGITVHTSTTPPTSQETVIWDGLKVTSPARTISDVAESGTSPEHVERAVIEALERGITTVQQIRDSAAHRSGRVQSVIEQALDLAVA